MLSDGVHLSSETSRLRERIHLGLDQLNSSVTPAYRRSTPLHFRLGWLRRASPSSDAEASIHVGLDHLNSPVTSAHRRSTPLHFRLGWLRRACPKSDVEASISPRLEAFGFARSNEHGTTSRSLPPLG
jgi:hypothetical protein